MIFKPALFALTCLTAPFAALADTRAVLVGVGDYLYLDADLRGPVNDVGLLSGALMQRGVQAGAITVLSDDAAKVPEGITRGYPDRDAILTALGGAIEASEAGDTVLFYYSGHGAQTPDLNGDEGGGYDEIFLPRDAKGWNGGTGTVENAILDDDFAAFARAADQRGVKLVAIIDACHSGTGFRALGDSQGAGQARFISLAELGVPEDDGDTQGEAPPPPGEYVFLYATQADERAYEYPIAEGGPWHGDFTRSLVAVLAEADGLSYAQWVAAATERMKARTGQLVQTPDIEGPLADAPVLDGAPPAPQRFGVSRTKLDAGLLQDVTQGSTLTLYASLLDDTPRGTATVSKVGALTSEIAYDDPRPTVAVTHAVMTDRAIDASAVLALSDDAAGVLGGRDSFAARLDAPLSPPGTPGATTIVQHGNDLIVVGPDGVIDPSGPGSSLRLSSDPVQAAAQVTRVIGRLRLERALAQVPKPAATGLSLLKTEAEVAFSATPGQLADGRCRPGSAPAEIVLSPVALETCVILTVDIRNPTAKRQDVTLLYVTSDSAVTVLWPARNQSNRLDVGATKRLRYRMEHDGAPGTVQRESLIVLSVPAEAGDARTVFDTLATGSVTRGQGTPLAAWLGTLTDPATATRGFTLKPKGPALAVSRLDFTLTRANGP